MSGAFAETLAGIARHRARRAEHPWAFCTLTATPRTEDGVFRLTADESSEEAIAHRLAASKPARLVLVGAETDGGVAATYAETARDLAACCNKPDPVVAVVVNRVGAARLIHRALSKDGGANTILLTGRVRPVERDELIEAYGSRLLAGARQQAETPLFVVATQCIEAGADFDFDALVTQIAPLDALRQRFGRVDRLGTRGVSAAAILTTKTDG